MPADGRMPGGALGGGGAPGDMPGGGGVPGGASGGGWHAPRGVPGGGGMPGGGRSMLSGGGGRGDVYAPLAAARSPRGGATKSPSLPRVVLTSSACEIALSD
jgi:hypothetical protein